MSLNPLRFLVEMSGFSRFDEIIAFFLTLFSRKVSDGVTLRSGIFVVLEGAASLIIFGYYLYRKYPDLGMSARGWLGTIKGKLPGGRIVLTRVIPAVLIGVLLVAVWFAIKASRNVGSPQGLRSKSEEVGASLPVVVPPDYPSSGTAAGDSVKTGDTDRQAYRDAVADVGKVRPSPRKQQEGRIDRSSRLDSTRESPGPGGRELIGRYQKLGNAFRDEGEYGKAIEIYSRILNLDKENREAKEGIERARKAAAAEEAIRRKMAEIRREKASGEAIW